MRRLHACTNKSNQVVMMSVFELKLRNQRCQIVDPHGLETKLNLLMFPPFPHYFETSPDTIL